MAVENIEILSQGRTMMKQEKTAETENHRDEQILLGAPFFPASAASAFSCSKPPEYSACLPRAGFHKTAAVPSTINASGRFSPCPS